jgi:probable HAF family extracellular repeat protein
MRRYIWLAVSCLVVLAGCGSNSGGLGQYNVLTLHALPGSNTASPIALNDQGVVVGSSLTGPFNIDSLPPGSAVVWQNGTVTDLPELPGDAASGAVDINNAGTIVGVSSTSNNAGFHAVKWQNGIITQLPGLPGAQDSAANAINNPGDIVGISGNHPVRWQNGVIQDLGVPPGFVSGQAIDINDQGQILIQAWTTNYDSARSFLLDQGVLKDLGSLGGTRTEAYRISNTGQIIGRATNSSERLRAVRWQATILQDITPSGAQDGEALGQNEAGLIVGEKDAIPTLWEGGHPYDLRSLLNLPGRVNITGNAINPSGQIALGDGEAGIGWLLTPK